MHYNKFAKSWPAWAALATLAACSGSDDAAKPGTPVGTVSGYMADLPDWETYSPLLSEEPPTATGEPVDAGTETLDVEVINDDGTTSTLADVNYVCRETPYRLTENPEEIVMFSPDREILWPGALVQGGSYARGLGSLRPLVITERNPIEVSIPGLATGGGTGGANFREVANPSQASVEAAIGDMIGEATRDTLDRASSISFSMETYHSEESWALSVSASGRYLGFSASAEGDKSRNASETTVTAKFVQKMYEVVVAPPQTPSAFFSSAFTEARLQEQVDLGRIGPDNIPVYVSEVVYGRMLMFSMTSTASASEIRGTISAAYHGMGAAGGATLTAQQEKILEKSKIAITAIGGPAEATQAIIRSGNLNAYFTRSAALSTAVPLSYTFRNLSDGTIAQVTESTDYVIRECTAEGASGEPFAFLPEQVVTANIATPATAVTGDFNGDGRTDIAWSHTSAGLNQTVLGLATGGGSFTYIGPIDHPASPGEGWAAFDAHVGDINGDGNDDLVWNARGAQNVTYLGFSDGSGGLTFGERQVHALNGWGTYRLYVGPVNADRYDDLVWNTTGTTNRLYVGLGSGDGILTMLASQDHSASGWGAYDTYFADINGDGRTDLVWNNTYATGNGTYAATANANGTYSYRAHYARSGNGWDTYAGVVGDINGDSRADMVWVRNSGADSAIHMSYATASGFTAGPLVWSRGDRAGAKAEYLLDIDGDGLQDIVLNHQDGLVNAVYVGLSTHSNGFLFTPLAMDHPYRVSWDQYQTLVGDFDGDGRQDMAWTHPAATNRLFVGLSAID
ncbi:MAG: thiol-activated cytolysin family protein [Krumholzibacteria bacterium]|nr:thiol-activated cytolysin family protein [Candidatus Krumholzibacteria bacterium]